MAVRKAAGAKAPAKTSSVSAQGGRSNKNSPKREKNRSWIVLFWLAFVIFIFGLFLFNREAISGSIQAIKNEMSSRGSPAKDAPLSGPAAPSLSERPAEEGSSPPAAALSPREQIAPPARTVPPTAAKPAPDESSPPTATLVPPAQTISPAARTGNVPPEQVLSPERNISSTVPPAGSRPAATPAAAPPQTAAPPDAAPAAQNAGPPQTRPEPPGKELRERVLYFTQIDGDGSILRIKVNRKLPVSDSPMTDVIQALIAGPSGDEKREALISLIPPDTRILSATVRGDTAYISFSEEFQYNTYGVEGYAGQLRQVIFTITEFSNIRDVQILIEGRRVDYLGEGIWIGSPISREML